MKGRPNAIKAFFFWMEEDFLDLPVLFEAFAPSTPMVAIFKEEVPELLSIMKV
jgi:hypothetical protein